MILSIDHREIFCAMSAVSTFPYHSFRIHAFILQVDFSCIGSSRTGTEGSIVTNSSIATDKRTTTLHHKKSKIKNPEIKSSTLSDQQLPPHPFLPYPSYKNPHTSTPITSPYTHKKNCKYPNPYARMLVPGFSTSLGITPRGSVSRERAEDPWIFFRAVS